MNSMPAKSTSSLAQLALKSARIELGEPCDMTGYQVDVRNRVTVHHTIVRCRFDKPPEAARRYRFFRPRLVRDALAMASDRKRSSAEAFFKQYAPDYLRGSISSSSYDHDFPPLAYKQRTEKVVDRVETQPCSRCSGKGNYRQSRSETTRTPCFSCGGMGGRSVTEYLYKPGTTAHGAPVQSFRLCSSCGGAGTISGPVRNWTETVTCTRCKGSGVLEKKYFRKQTVFLADAVRSHFERKAAFTWPKEIRRLIDYHLVQENALFSSCKKSSEYRRTDGDEVLIDLKVNLAIARHSVEGVKGAASTVSVLHLDNEKVLFADTPVLDPYLKRLRKELAALSWKQVGQRAEQDAFLKAMIRNATRRRKPKALAAELGFMASRRQVGALMRLLRRIERRRRVIAWVLLLGFVAAAAYTLVFHWAKVGAFFRSLIGS